MNLYLLRQRENNTWDTYDSCVVAAETEEQARVMRPCFGGEFNTDWSQNHYWASKPENVEVKLIGTAVEGTPVSLIIASFNAG